MGCIFLGNKLLQFEPQAKKAMNAKKNKFHEVQEFYQVQYNNMDIESSMLFFHTRCPIGNTTFKIIKSMLISEGQTSADNINV